MEYCRIAPDVKLGKNVSSHAFVNLYGCTIGDNAKLGTFVEIQKNARIGKNVKVSSHTFICEGVTIEDECSSATTYRSSTTTIRVPRGTANSRRKRTGRWFRRW
jgi:UDP-3-O-[3-hydroxymyristoyl] glucosamine N-acyltransferase